MPAPQPSQCPLLLGACGALAALGGAALAIGNVIGGVVVPNHDWISDTVSDLAAGPYESIQDVALHSYAAALLACAIGAAHRHMDGRRWGLGVLILAVLALLVTIIGARNEYGDGDADGFVIHIYLVYALGVLFFAGPLVMARGMRKEGRVYGWIAIGVAIFWAISGPLFFIAPTSIDGLVERILGLAALVWTTTLAVMMMRAAARMEATGA